MVVCNPDIPSDQCTLETCCIQDQGFVDYLPTIPGNAVYLSIFAILGLLQFGLGIRYKTWGFMIAMVCGCILECVSYVGRIMMHNNIFDMNNFVIYITPSVIAPAFVSAGIYLCLSRIVTVYGHGLARFRPVTYTLTFIGCDFFSLVLQGTGGGLSATSDSQSSSDTGVNIMIAGLVFQVVSLGLFIIVSLDFAWRVRKYPGQPEPRFAEVQRSTRWKAFLSCLALGVFTIFVRCVFRCAELSQGYDGSLANDEVTFMILEGPMIFIAVTGLTVFHPGFAFMGRWADAGWNFRKGKQIIDMQQEKTFGA